MRNFSIYYLACFILVLNASSVVAQAFSAKGVDFELVKVEGGTFMMGNTWADSSDNEHPTRSIKLRSYSIGKTEVTQALWNKIMQYNPSRNNTCEQCPVENITWEDAQEFIKRLNKVTKKTFRLPTEAEWEYAARGGNKSKNTQYAGSDKIDDVAWYSATTQSLASQPVGTKAPNELGIYDMTGNVFEWCYDWSENRNRKKDESTDDEKAEEEEETEKPEIDRVIRGGSWLGGAPEALIYYRRVLKPNYQGSTCGIRLVYDPL
jgi:formylglycine-generating enzyme required for sulfatase activity